MQSTDPPSRPDGRSGPTPDRDESRGRHRARHADAAPDAYPGDQGRPESGAYQGDPRRTAPPDGRHPPDDPRRLPPGYPDDRRRSGAGAHPDDQRRSGAGAHPDDQRRSGAGAHPDDQRRPEAGAYPDERYPYSYGDGRSAEPMYGRPPAGPARGRPPVLPGRPQAGPGRPGGPAGSGALDEPTAPQAAPVPGRSPGGRTDRAPGPGALVPAVPLPPLDLDLSDDGRTGRTREERRAVATEAKKSRAGRNLPAAIGVGVLLAAIVLGSLFLWRPAFVGVLALGAAIGVWEMTRVLATPSPEGAPPRAQPPLVPLAGGCLVMPALAWYGGTASLVLGLLVTVLATVIWRLSAPPVGFYRDIASASMIAVYVPFLLSFGVLLAVPHDGDMRVLTVLALVVLSDTGGYAAGVFLGKHPMAPSVSPKKSWEGLGGSLLASATGGALLVAFNFHEPWWHGAVLGLAVSAAAVVGDLSESLIKRDLKIKDMSDLLPGHGGLMDRLDSVVFAAPTAFMVMALLVPVG